MKQIRLPEGWDSELRNLESQIKERVENISNMSEEEIRKLEKRTRPYHRDGDPYFTIIDDLSFQIDEFWEKTRRRYSTRHPERKPYFDSVDDASRVLAHYWQGQELNERDLLKSIQKGVRGYNGLLPDALSFAEKLTSPNSPERDYVHSALDFLVRKITGRVGKTERHDGR